MNCHGKSIAPFRFVAAVALFLCSLVVAADTPWVPPLEGRVTDTTSALSAMDRDRITEMLARYEQETSHQLAVLVVSTLSGESIESFSLRVANAWGLGRTGLNNGILVTLALKEKKVRIELGLGMQKYVSNAMAQFIMGNLMVPAFRNGDYAGGLQAGLEQLMKDGRRFVVTPADLQRAKER